ncbi:MAG: LysE family transporter [Pseudomonadota bacterium]
MFDWFDYTFFSGFLFFVVLPYVVCIISPGPDFAMIARNSLMHSRRIGVFTAFGTSVSLAIHASYTLVGIALLINDSVWGLRIIQALGAIYLCYIGWQSFRVATPVIDAKGVDKSEQGLSSFAAFRQGFLTDLLNPMAVIFFLSIFSMVVTDETPHLAKVLYGAVIFILGFLWFGLVAIGFSHPKVQELFARMGHWLGRITGGILFSLGVKLAFMVAP